MDRQRVGVVGIAAAVVALAGSYATVGDSPRFLVARFNAVIVGATPGILTTSAIQELGHLAGMLAFGVAAVLAVAVLAFSVALGIIVGDRVDINHAQVGATVLFVWDVAVLVTGEFRTALAPAIAAAAIVALAKDREATGDDGAATILPNRRAVLRMALGTFGISAIGRIIGSNQSPGPRPTYNASETVRAGLQTARKRSFDVAGLEPLVSESFYQVDINQIDPVVTASDWTLSVTGAVNSPLELNYEDLRARSAEHRFVTLRCVGDALDGRQMDTALWTGLPVDPVLNEASTPERCCVILRAADGYYEEFPLEALRGSLLAWGMNGDVLPRRHGHPLRALIPGHWGEVNVKWLTEIEVLDEPTEGYWEKRGWHGTGPVNAVAKLHVMNRLDNGHLQIAGHAYAGTRGVSRVEVSTDGGDSWARTRLSDRLPGPVDDEGVVAEDTAETHAADAWRQWTFEYRPPQGAHEVIVRTVDSDGTIQPAERSRAYPNGATGWVRERVNH
jgi:DMSO/TMAO reductase YedYZ molybdopterin-dependent catalytic subunit